MAFLIFAKLNSLIENLSLLLIDKITEPQKKLAGKPWP